ncbi:fibroblast growth factor 1 [Asbolus verrucosus]|uniref:Fibroblast growth factor 1 n=1 Tax=Asbolus verrucosus TaxID=1661398 RepID=A0A482VI33_ASBVE|nr:fibroblast growth factor 1 [Asbolus verrucosus]
MHGNAEWHGNQMQLYSETRYNLTIRGNGEVLGTQDSADSDSKLELTSAGDVSIVRIRGLESQLYLCFDPEGNLYGEADPDAEATVFEEHFQGSYTGFRSKAYPDWYVGIKKSGLAKNGKRTRWGQKAVKFLPRKRNFCS